MKSLSLAAHEVLKIGDDITIAARHNGNQVRLIIHAPQGIKIERMPARDFDEEQKVDSRVQWVRSYHRDRGYSG